MVINSQIINLNQIFFPMISDLYGWGKSFIQNKIKPGLYEVLDYETTLEILDKRGKNALLTKVEEVRFLQNNIIAFQDQAWGEGKFLLDYRCNPGIPVDFYQLGHKTHVLISLREVKNKGDVVKFNIQWGVRNGYLKRNGFWATDVNHFTKSIKVNVILPMERPPTKLWAIEINSQRTGELLQDTIDRLPDGKWKITWVKNHPKINEHYILKWAW